MFFPRSEKISKDSGRVVNKGCTGDFSKMACGPAGHEPVVQNGSYM